MLFYRVVVPFADFPLAPRTWLLHSFGAPLNLRRAVSGTAENESCLVPPTPVLGLRAAQNRTVFL